jgi:hypothetical protein
MCCFSCSCQTEALFWTCMFLRVNRVCGGLQRFKSSFNGSLRNNSTLFSQNDTAVKPRTIFSGIQPTGIPHVRLLVPATRFLKWATAGKLSRSALQLGETPERKPARQVHIFDCRMARVDSPPKSERACCLPARYAGRSTGYWYRP